MPKRKQLVKRLLILALAALCDWHAHAQGTFIFSNFMPEAGLDRPVFDIGGATKVDGFNGMVAAIYLNGERLGAVAPFRTGAGAGYWTESERVVPGKFAGEVVSGFAVHVWDLRRGADAYAACMAQGRAAISAPFSILLGGPSIDPALPGNLPGVMSNFQSFQIFVPICVLPEPGALALGGLGAVMLAAWRRRK
jgi:hypothetical protein